jgi:xyloglucan 6-xylosyltransferase
MQLGNGVNGPGSKWPFISHFTGCKFCHMQYGDDGKYEECLENFDKIYHFANNQVLEHFGLRHKGLENTEVTPV